MALYLRDAEPRLASEALASRLGEAHLRRRQALEINDNVVQGLVAAAYALDQGQIPTSLAYLDQTLSAARAMMDDLLEPLDGEGLQPGDLVRTTPAAIGLPPDAAASHLEETIDQKDSHRVLVVDDAEDLRMLLRARMETRNGLTVVGEAADGLAAVELASELQPDLVMLDLAMPRMDGLEALPLIRAAVPGRPGHRALRLQPEHPRREGDRGRRRQVRRQGRLDATAARARGDGARPGVLTLAVCVPAPLGTVET